jgi:hypothetical protein
MGCYFYNNYDKGDADEVAKPSQNGLLAVNVV